MPGKVASTDEYLIELGTGYYVEQNADKTIEYCTRKVDLLKENCTTLEKEIDSKKKFIEQITMHMQQKALAQQKQAMEAQKNDKK